MPCKSPNWNWEKKEEGLRGIRHSGHIRNMIVSWKNGELLIMGSLPKYLLGNNFYNLTTLQVDQAIKGLENALNVNLQEAIVNRIDFGACIKLQNSINSYFACLGQYKTTHRSNIDASSLYYNYVTKGMAQLIFYDKIREMKADYLNKGLLRSLQGNYMRFELRYRSKKSIKSIFKNELKVCDLSSVDINVTLAYLWHKTYLDVKKQSISEFNLKTGDLIKELINKLAKVAIDHLGGASAAIEILKRSPCFINTRPENRCRLKNKINEISSISNLTNESPLLTELNNEVEGVFTQTTHVFKH